MEERGSRHDQGQKSVFTVGGDKEGSVNDVEGVFAKQPPIFFFLDVYCCAVALIPSQPLCCAPPVTTCLTVLTLSVLQSLALHKMHNTNAS